VNGQKKRPSGRPGHLITMKLHCANRKWTRRRQTT